MNRSTETCETNKGSGQDHMTVVQLTCGKQTLCEEQTIPPSPNRGIWVQTVEVTSLCGWGGGREAPEPPKHQKVADVGATRVRDLWKIL